MITYTPDQLVKLSSDEIDILQKSNDTTALEYLKDQDRELSFLNQDQIAHLKEYYTDTMEKYRLLYEAIVSGFSTPTKPGFPEFIYNINLKDGSIETDRNGRRISYSTEILAPCTSAMLHYINSECNDVYVVIPPIKGVERTTEKIISECHRSYDINREKNLAKFADGAFAPIEEEPEFPFSFPQKTRHCATAEKMEQWRNEAKTKNALLNILSKDMLPHDIYRLSITSKYQGDLEELIHELEEKFPDYITFEKGERNLYKKNLSENERNYFDIKKTARINIPNSNRCFYIEFQFKQTNMFFAHIRSHSVYEEFRILEAKYLAAKDGAEKKKPTPETKAKITQLKKQCDEKREHCLRIHRNAVHQSNMYLMHKLLWLDDNARGLHRKPEHDDGKYQHSIDTLRRNYIVESYEPFNGATAFATGSNEYLNKAYYLKMIGILPESFDELGKTAKVHIHKAWENLTDADIKDFDRITTMAIKYQDTIRSIQKERRLLDNNALLNVLAQATGNSLPPKNDGR
ncbi:MAG: hypothetical protein NC218_05470 [Acetobacter sp.]|nr:hypothetical protein [Acetobacter sp.]